MTTIVTIDGLQLDALRAMLTGTRRVRLAIEPTGLMLAADASVWTPPFGTVVELVPEPPPLIREAGRNYCPPCTEAHKSDECERGACQCSCQGSERAPWVNP